jgi:hypothetical protein
MAVLISIKRTVEAAYRVFGSTNNTELAEIVILCIAGMIATVFVYMPDDQIGGALCSLLGWVMASQ